MPFPAVLPFGSIEILLSVLTKGLNSRPLREVVEAAYDVEGYALDKFFPVVPVAKQSSQVHDDIARMSDADKADILASLVAKKGLGADIPWMLILSIIEDIIKRLKGG